MAIGPFQLEPPKHKHPPVASSLPDVHGAPLMLERELEEVYNNILIASELLNQLSMVLPVRRPLRLIQTQAWTQVPRRLQLDVEHICWFLATMYRAVCRLFQSLSFCAFLLFAHVVAPGPAQKVRRFFDALL